MITACLVSLSRYGANREYVLMLAEAMRAIAPGLVISAAVIAHYRFIFNSSGVEDEHLFGLEALVRALLS